MRTPALAAAYRATTYRVFLAEAASGAYPAGGALDLRIGIAAPVLAAWLARHGHGGWLLVSAANPGSEQLPEGENEARHAALCEALHALGLSPQPGENLADDGLWPREATWLAGLPDPAAARAAAQALGRRFGQNAVVVGGADAVPELCWIR